MEGPHPEIRHTSEGAWLLGGGETSIEVKSVALQWQDREVRFASQCTGPVAHLDAILMNGEPQALDPANLDHNLTFALKVLPRVAG
jgi:hypothetical protein